MLDYEYIKTEDCAIYINFPFCKIPCSYCHYVDNIFFGYTEIPKDYFNLIITQLEDTLKSMQSVELDSIYFGGGTPSLLNDMQCLEIRKVFDKYNIHSSEVSMEIHPGMCNFDYINNDFFTRYSIGVQSFDDTIKKKYRRTSYTIEDVITLVNNIRNSNVPRVINIDLIFETQLMDIDLEYINLLKPETVTFYPNTKGRGRERLVSVLRTLNWIEEKIQGYYTLGKSKYIYIRCDSHQSYYSRLEYEKNGNIIGIGHNSVSYVGDISYLCRFENEQIIIKERINKKDRILNAMMMGIASGVTKETVLKYYPEIYKAHFLMTVNEDMDVLDKHISVKQNELIYLPESEYLRFYYFLCESGRTDLANTFLGAIGFGDTAIDVIEYAYNKVLLLNHKELDKLKNLVGEDTLRKIKTPNINILIEGIDGSGKDTFARLFVKELKKRFLYETDSRISIIGEPNSKLDCGIEAKKFVEDVEYVGDWRDVRNILTKNRIASENLIKNIPGIKILVRGLVTDKATFYRVFSRNEKLGEGKEIKKWNRYIVVDVPVEIADQRIEKRGIPRTWRESLEHLTYFREYYINYENDMFENKEIIENMNMEYLKTKAIEMADDIYAKAIKGKG